MREVAVRFRARAGRRVGGLTRPLTPTDDELKWLDDEVEKRAESKVRLSG